MSDRSNLRVYSTRSGQKEAFAPLGETVLMYVCGMTPKFHPHIGHARLFVAVDAIRRHLAYRGYRLRHVQNFTDIDDKIIARANQEGATAQEVADRYTQTYFEVMDALGVQRADIYPSVTRFMSEIIAFVQQLIDKGYGYVVDGDVYFAVERFPDYGKLSGRTEEGGLVGVRKELEPGKRDPRDFALWKSAKEGEPAWDSPWGKGRPGWHIECSTMVRETLGDQIDIHSGAQDLIFPHHENEIAQSEALTGKRPFARYWPHIGLVTTAGEKMSHSLNNFTTVQDVLQSYSPMAVRLYLLATHYRSPISFSEEGLAAASRGLQRLRSALVDYLPETAPAARPEYVERYVASFGQAMDDDFNTAGAIGYLFDLARDINRRRSEGAPREEVAGGQATLMELANAIGLRLWPADEVERHQELEPFIALLVSTRQRLREAKQWKLADEIRAGLAQLGVVLEDHPEGTTWRWAEAQP